jgi:hypothetical protein
MSATTPSNWRFYGKSAHLVKLGECPCVATDPQFFFIVLKIEPVRWYDQIKPEPMLFLFF